MGALRAGRRAQAATVPLVSAVPAAVMPLCGDSAAGTGRACGTKERGLAH